MLSVLLLSAWIVTHALAQPSSCLNVSDSGDVLEIALSDFQDTSPCLVVPGLDSEQYRLTIFNSIYGYYSITDGSGGYAWGESADGIYYCTMGGGVLFFDEYPPGAIVRVQAELKNNDCNSDVISNNGVTPIEPPDWSPNSTEVYWSSHSYYLKAVHFEYQVQGEAAVTMEGATDIEVDGDPGSSTYSTIEIRWQVGEKEKRLNVYLSADSSSWWIDEVRVYNEDEEWETIESPNVTGSLQACTQLPELVIGNDRFTIRFMEIAIAAFLPWSDEDALLSCVSGTLLSMSATNLSDLESSKVQSGISKTLEISPLQVDFPQRSEGRLLSDTAAVSVRIAGRDQQQAACLRRRVEQADFQTDLQSELGAAGLEVEVVKSSANAVDCTHDGVTSAGYLSAHAWIWSQALMLTLGIYTLQ